ncbi:hypothetical protein BLA29_009765 [Euroglyphus maynei]|uniref:Transmembrane protein 218 n=1 Tax=Euroglyphus maynei TaxID=6958 RepID=A0A1Y3AMJ5_EURMA|nr:hypothetical protein BLA29_009765 [Euroglyphus maynei]
MTQLILGLGIGLFTLLLLWAIAIIFCLISSRLRAPASYIGPASCLIALFITIILLSLPISKRLDHQLSMMMMNDNQSIIEDDGDEHSISIVDWNTYIILPLCLLISLILLIITTIMSIQYHLLSFSHRSRMKI